MIITINCNDDTIQFDNEEPIGIHYPYEFSEILLKILDMLDTQDEYERSWFVTLIRINEDNREQLREW